MIAQRARTTVVALLVAVSAAIASAAVMVAPAAATDDRAVVVIDTGSGVRRTVISFSGTVTGLQALLLAGANPVTYGYAGQGAAVCALDGVGHEATQSSCLGTPGDPRYWAYFRAPAGATDWTYAKQCACTSTVHGGDVEGWRFGVGAAPPFRSFCDVVGCAPAPTSPPPGAGSSAGGSGSGVAAPGDSSSGSGTTGSNSAASPGANVTVPPSSGRPTEPATGSNTAPMDDQTGNSPSGATTPAGTAESGGTDARVQRAGRSERALGPTRGSHSTSGSPWGVIVAALALLGAVAAVLWRRRRRSV